MQEVYSQRPPTLTLTQHLCCPQFIVILFSSVRCSVILAARFNKLALLNGLRDLSRLGCLICLVPIVLGQSLQAAIKFAYHCSRLQCCKHTIEDLLIDNGSILSLSDVACSTCFLLPAAVVRIAHRAPESFHEGKLDMLPNHLETDLASCWERVRLPRASGQSPNFPGSSRRLPRKFSYCGTLQQSKGSPDFPEVRGLPRRSALSLGSLTPSSDSPNLPLNHASFTRRQQKLPPSSLGS